MLTRQEAITRSQASPPLGCDQPSEGSSRCLPGSRVLKYEQQIPSRTGGGTETMITYLLCRKTSQFNRPEIFSDVAVVQQNVQRNRTCWFNVLGSLDATNIAAPHVPGLSAGGSFFDRWKRA